MKILLGTGLSVLLAAAFAPAAEVWCPNPLVEIAEGIDYTGKDDAKAVLRLVGTRNGAVSGQVVVYSKTAMKGPEAAMGDRGRMGSTSVRRT